MNNSINSQKSVPPKPWSLVEITVVLCKQVLAGTGILVESEKFAGIRVKCRNSQEPVKYL